MLAWRSLHNPTRPWNPSSRVWARNSRRTLRPALLKRWCSAYRYSLKSTTLSETYWPRSIYLLAKTRVKPAYPFGRSVACRVSVQLWGFHFRSVGFGGGRRWKVRDSVFRGREASLVQPRVSVSHGRQARGSRLRASLPPVIQFYLTHSEGWVGCFLAAVAGLLGISEGNDGGDFPRAVKPEFFGRAPI